MGNNYYAPRRNYVLNPETPEEIRRRGEKQREAVRKGVRRDLKAWAESQGSRFCAGRPQILQAKKIFEPCRHQAQATDLLDQQKDLPPKKSS